MGKCNCESLICPHHRERIANTGVVEQDFKSHPCSCRTDGQHKMIYAGDICDSCATHAPTKFMLKVDGRETTWAWKERMIKEAGGWDERRAARGK